MSLLDLARSHKRGTLDDAAIHALARELRNPSLRDVVADIVSELDDYEGDAFLHEGDLVVQGDFDAAKLGVALLVVRGNLIVEGSYRDYDDPRTIVVVTGDLRARDVVTAGYLEVGGALRVSGSIIGDYNDCDAWVGGDVECRLLYPEEHSFTVGGKLRAQHVVDAEDRVEVDPPAVGLEMDSRELLELFDRELLNVTEDDDEIVIDGFEDFDELKRRVIAGRPLKTP